MRLAIRIVQIPLILAHHWTGSGRLLRAIVRLDKLASPNETASRPVDTPSLEYANTVPMFHMKH